MAKAKPAKPKRTPKPRAKTAPKTPQKTHDSPSLPTDDWSNDPPPETGDVASPEPISQPNKPLRRDRWPVTDPLTRGLAEVCLKTHSQAPTDSQDCQSDKSSAPQAIQTKADADQKGAKPDQPTGEAGEVGSPAIRDAPQTANVDHETKAGDDTLGPAVADTLAGIVLPESLPRACRKDGENRGQCWERLRREGRTAGLNRRLAITYAGFAIEQVWPQDPAPVEDEPPPEPEEEPPAPEPEPNLSPMGDVLPESQPSPSTADQGVSGLGDLPADWPKLPPNASLASEIQWVQASRLDVIERTDRGGIRVNLAKADRPPPSKGALGWLETSLLFPSKFADVAVKASANQDDEREQIRREKLSIEEIRRILAEMLEG